jgi:6,7-dimethyl-8-ribityllumazine synthase
MARELRGEQAASPGGYAVVVSQYNDTITRRLLDGALGTLRAAGVADEAIRVAWAPGAFELPLIVDRLAGSGDYVAVLCLGAVIRGETSHDQHINRAVSLQLMEIGVTRGVPVLFGLLTCDTLEQALQRAGGTVGNKGVECAQAALAMASLLRQL